MAWEENSCICLHMQLIAILSRIGVINARRIGTRVYYTEKDINDALKKVSK